MFLYSFFTQILCLLPSHPEAQVSVINSEKRGLEKTTGVIASSASLKKAGSDVADNLSARLRQITMYFQ